MRADGRGLHESLDACLSAIRRAGVGADTVSRADVGRRYRASENESFGHGLGTGAD
jgi:hypothetical protein